MDWVIRTLLFYQFTQPQFITGVNKKYNTWDRLIHALEEENNMLTTHKISYRFIVEDFPDK